MHRIVFLVGEGLGNIFVINVDTLWVYIELIVILFVYIFCNQKLK